MQRTILLTLGALSAMMLGSTLAASAQVAVYNNTVNFTGQAVTNGGATTAIKNTFLLADDINTLAGVGGLNVTEFKFTVANFATAAVTAQPIINFYAADGASGGPGTFLGGFTFNAISFAAGSVATFTYNSPTLDAFTIPLNGSFWAGETFTGTATAANLNKLGEGIFNPPTIGSSQDEIFASTGTGTFQASNPAGSIVASPFGGAPVGNLGFEFEVLSIPTAAPEPSAWASLLVGGLGLCLLGLRAYKRRLEDAFGLPA